MQRRASIVLRFGLDVRNEHAGVRFEPKRRPSRTCRGLLTFRGLLFREGEGLPDIVGLCTVKSHTKTRALAMFGDVLAVRRAAVQAFVDTHKLSDSERARLEALQREYRQAVRRAMKKESS